MPSGESFTSCIYLSHPLLTKPPFRVIAALSGRASPKLKFRGFPTNNKPFTSTGRWSVTRGLRTDSDRRLSV